MVHYGASQVEETRIVPTVLVNDLGIDDLVVGRNLRGFLLDWRAFHVRLRHKHRQPAELQPWNSAG